ncbi:hypothetical protein ACFQJD_05040 [Haloplanus sp. GCM10025708]|uniref:hypothetical protein n=1 Tax=Haloplanus sp. GCM10025708 TaxID=3252679 RepID=UPI0036085768
MTVNATDPNGALSTASVELVSPTGTQNTTNTSITGGVSTVIPISGPDVSQYRVVTTVVDAAGNRRSVTEKHETDGDDAGCPP